LLTRLWPRPCWDVPHAVIQPVCANAGQDPAAITIAAANANPGQIPYASSSPGTIAHLWGELFGLETGAKLTHIPYKGAAPATVDLLAGRVTVQFAPASTVVSHVKAGRLKALATIGRKAAVADFGWFQVWGAPAWWFWGAVHLGFLVGVRNRVSVMFDWFWAYLTFRGGTRLITGGGAAAATEGRVSVPSVKAAA
jgi:hypothetical protein